MYSEITWDDVDTSVNWYEMAPEWVSYHAESYRKKFKKIAETENFADLWIEWYLDDLDDAIKFMKEAKITYEEMICYAYVYVDKNRYTDCLDEVYERNKKEIDYAISDENNQSDLRKDHSNWMFM